MSETIAVNLTMPEVSHLLSLLDERIEDGSYYGSRRQYYARTKRIVRKLEDSMSVALGFPAERE